MWSANMVFKGLAKRVIQTWKPLIILLLALYVATNLSAQNVNVDFQFGIHVPKPYLITETSLQSKWTHNFWMGVNYRKKLNEHAAFHSGLFINGINYRFSSPDSPQTTFLTMTYLSIPFQIEYKLKHPKMGLKAGIEPKYSLSGREYTASPTHTTRINFASADGIYSRYNLALRAGITYRTKETELFLQLCSDHYPVKSYKSTRIFDNKITFGFVMFPIFKK
jgi:hypothetical protein